MTTFAAVTTAKKPTKAISTLVPVSCRRRSIVAVMAYLLWPAEVVGSSRRFTGGAIHDDDRNVGGCTGAIGVIGDQDPQFTGLIGADFNRSIAVRGKGKSCNLDRRAGQTFHCKREMPRERALVQKPDGV